MRTKTRRVLVGAGIRDAHRYVSDEDLYASHYGSVVPECVILGTNNNTNAAGTSHNITLPASIRAGELIMAFASLQDDAFSATPGGWTVLTSFDAGVNGVLAVWKLADGSEGGTNITASSAASRVSACASLRIGGWAGAAPFLPPGSITSSGAGSTSRDMPPFSNPFCRDALVIVVCAIGGSDAARNPTAYPSGYTYVQVHTNIAGATNDAGIAVGAQKNVSAAGDPGNFTYGAGVGYAGLSILVRGAGDK